MQQKRRIKAGYVPIRAYAGHTTNYVLIKENKYNLFYVLALLNSSLIDYYFGIFNNTNHVPARELKRLPIYSIDFTNYSEKSIHDKLAGHAKKMLSLNEQANEINVDFGHYVGLHIRIDDMHLGRFLEKIGVEVEDKEVLNYANQKEGRIVGFEVTEEGEWLAFTVEYERKTRGGNVDRAKMKAIRCKITDERLRKFLYYSIREFITPSKVGAGNLYERILKINVPRFHDNWEKNVETINEIMDAYLPRIQKWQQLKEDIRAADQQIDQMVYDLYGLTDEEIRIVEESLGER